MHIETFVASQLCGFIRPPYRNGFVDVSNIKKILDDRILKITQGDDVIYRDDYEKILFGISSEHRSDISHTGVAGLMEFFHNDLCAGGMTQQIPFLGSPFFRSGQGRGHGTGSAGAAVQLG